MLRWVEVRMAMGVRGEKMVRRSRYGGLMGCEMKWGWVVV